MLAELIMSRCGWDAVWFLAARGATLPPGARWWHFLRKGACLVGTWTGPDGDLLCVRPCLTVEEAERWLAPPGRTVLDATTRSLWLLMDIRPRRIQDRDRPVDVRVE